MKLDWKLLSAFEAVARHGNFSRAAAELNVMQPAMSRRVSALEELLGTKLISRSRPLAKLTVDGEILFHAVSSSQMHVRNALDQIQQRAEQTVLTVNTSIGFASCYLMSRLSGFSELYPDIAVELVSRDLNEDYKEEAADVVVVFSAPDKLPGIEQRLIFREVLAAFCSPAFDRRDINSLEDLTRQKLLYLNVEIHDSDWDLFFDGTGLNAPVPGSGERFTSFIVYLQAALSGRGIILGWETLLDDQLKLGQLLRLTDRIVATDRGYFACKTTRAKDNQDAEKFMEWIESLEQDC